MSGIAKKRYIIGVDTGGTFTDVVVSTEKGEHVLGGEGTAALLFVKLKYETGG